MTRPSWVAHLPLVVLGGALGGLARHGLDVAYPASTFPWSTFSINAVGSAVLALLPALAPVVRRPALVALLGPGVLGGFTTLSAFSEQTRALADSGHGALAATYAVGSVATALVAVLAVRRFTTPAERAVFEAEGGDE